MRVQMARLEAELDRLDGESDDLTIVAQLAREFLVDLAAHTQFEDMLLAPVLHTLDAWGPVRADALLQHHAQQRESMRALMAAYAGSVDLAQIVRMTTRLIVEVRADMLHEETTLLAKIARSVDMTDGRVEAAQHAQLS